MRLLGYIVIYVLIVGMAIAFLYFTPDVIHAWTGLPAPGTAGEFGDQFGLANALFAGLAFAGIILAILMQREELQLQRQELKSTRKVLEQQQQQIVRQTATADAQRFEITFFNLLSLHANIVENVYWKDVDERGRLAVKTLRDKLMLQLRHGGGDDPHWPRRVSDPAERPQAIREAFEWTYRAYLADRLGHYFRTVYNIVRFVDTSSVGDKMHYVRLLRAQLSEAELVLLFYNCVSSYGERKAKPLFEKYNLFDNLPKSALASEEDSQWVRSDYAH